MRPCPLCREEIQDDAIKCRHCHSLLVPLGPIEPSKGETQDQNAQITYVLDRDLVRFAKFAGAVLGVLLVAGTYLFGFRLESALDEMDDAQEELALTQKELAAAKQVVSQLKRDVEQVLGEARAQLGSITETRRRADELYIGILSQRDSEDSGKKLVLKVWQPGRTISVGFLDGSRSARAAVEAVAKEWTRHANIKFNFVDESEADIRVSFKQGGAWSYVGTDALIIPKGQPTMALIEPVDGGVDKAFRSAVLRHFGFVLGLINEHSNPRATIKWDKEAVYRYYSAPPYNWTKQVVDANLFAKFSSISPFYREFDPDSVMMLPIPDLLTLDAFEASANSELSPGDKELVAKLYPRN